MRREAKAMLEVLVVGLFAAAMHIALRSELLRGPGSAALSDLVGCVLAGGALFGVLAMRSLAADVDRAQIVDDGLASLAVCAWLVATLPPRLDNYAAHATTDDFVNAYAPASLAAVAMLLGAGALWPARTVKALLVRHAWVLAVAAPLTGVLLYVPAVRPVSWDELLRAGGVGVGWLVAGLVARRVA